MEFSNSGDNRLMNKSVPAYKLVWAEKSGESLWTHTPLPSPQYGKAEAGKISNTFCWLKFLQDTPAFVKKSVRYTCSKHFTLNFKLFQKKKKTGKSRNSCRVSGGWVGAESITSALMKNSGKPHGPETNTKRSQIAFPVICIAFSVKWIQVFKVSTTCIKSGWKLLVGKKQNWVKSASW